LSVDNSQCLRVLERMNLKAKSVKHTPKHPHVSLAAHFVVPKSVDHFWGSVHESSELSKVIKHLVSFVIVPRLKLSGGGGTKVTDFEDLVLQEDILNLDVPVSHALLVHIRDSPERMRLQLTPLSA